MCFSGPVAVAAEAPAKVSVAVVDLQRVMSEAKPAVALQAEFKASRDAQQKQLDRLYAGRLLSDTERASLEALYDVASPSAAQKQKITDLSKLSDEREKELTRLSALETPTDAERARRTELANWLEKQNQRAATLREGFDQTAQQKGADLNRRAVDLISTAIRTYSVAHGIDLVIEKQSVLFSRDVIDITAAIVQSMNASGPGGR